MIEFGLVEMGEMKLVQFLDANTPNSSETYLYNPTQSNENTSSLFWKINIKSNCIQ
jgi:hypothetical protein